MGAVNRAFWLVEGLRYVSESATRVTREEISHVEQVRVDDGWDTASRFAYNHIEDVTIVDQSEETEPDYASRKEAEEMISTIFENGDDSLAAYFAGRVLGYGEGNLKAMFGKIVSARIWLYDHKKEIYETAVVGLAGLTIGFLGYGLSRMFE